MKRRFKPDAGRYRKIDVFVDTIEGSHIYLHSTNAYDTLRHAEIGALLTLKKEAKPGYGWRYYATLRAPLSFFECAEVDPYSIKAFFAKRS